MTIGAESPTSIEIKSQLEHMLAGKRFKTAWSQAEFLELAVRRALEGKKTPGHIVAKTLFKEKFRKDESTDVRATANHLRATLKKYYTGEGHGDLVCIALPEPPEDKSIKLPEGEAYTPLFSYNSAHLRACCDGRHRGEAHRWRGSRCFSDVYEYPTRRSAAGYGGTEEYS